VLRVPSNRFFYLCFLIPLEESQADHAQLIMRFESFPCAPEKECLHACGPAAPRRYLKYRSLIIWGWGLFSKAAFFP